MKGASERSRIFGMGSGFPFESATISTFGRRGWSRLTAITRPTSPVLSLTMVRGGNTEISARSALMSGVAKSSCLERTISRMASWGGRRGPGGRGKDRAGGGALRAGGGGGGRGAEGGGGELSVRLRRGRARAGGQAGDPDVEDKRGHPEIQEPLPVVTESSANHHREDADRRHLFTH